MADTTTLEALRQCRDALQDGLSFCSSVRSGKDRSVILGDCTMYAQTAEWCEWGEEEVAPKIRAALAAADAALSVPAGWRLVPAEPTHDMVKAGRRAFRDGLIGSVSDAYRAMLAAATQPTPAALSVQAEPVAWRFAGSYWTRYESIHEALRKQVEPLYATPQPPAPVPAVPLTDKQIGDLIPFTNRQHSGVNAWGLADMVWFARAIERAHNITGGSND